MKTIQLIDSFSPRGYQQSLFANTMKKNSLIVLPTGLGKTLVALMHAVYRYNQSNKKVLFLAPTKPLVEQHEHSFKGFIKNNDSFIFQVLTGTKAPEKRRELYNNADFIFSTPQLIENDIINNRISPEDFSLIIIDEAHRATGGYAYCFIAEVFSNSTPILALTASPGTSKEEIEEVMNNLFLENLEVKRYEDEDVKPYVQETNILHKEVELTQDQKKIKTIYDRVIEKIVVQLQNIGVSLPKKPSKKDMLDIQTLLRKKISSNEADDSTWKAISLAAAVMKLHYGVELYESQDFHAAYLYFYNFFRESGDKSKAAEELSRNSDFRKAFDLLREIEKKGEEHPKLLALEELLIEELEKNPEGKFIIFNQYRETANHLVEKLQHNSKMNPVLFIGQNKKGNLGMSQKQQKKILEEFRSGIHNILISTSVGEEGLDIPKVDTVIFYEPVPSAIRTIQRIGRTGRFSKGKAYVLQTKGTRDIAIRYVASAKERSMYKALDAIQSEVKVNKQKGLNEYMKGNSNESEEEKDASSFSFSESKTKKDLQSSGEKSSVDSDSLILVDGRENNDLIKKLYRESDIEVEATQLDCGDIVITQEIGIERKAVGDFVSSLLDKRLFTQLIELAKNFRRPILIIEGEESLYAQRNMNPNAIRSALSAIAVDLRMPIIHTSSVDETIEFIKTINKRQKKDKNSLSLVSGKKSLNEAQEMEKVVSSIPKVNAVTAKQLLLHFNSLKEFANASKEELENVEGIGSIRAKYIYDFIRRHYKL